MKDYEKIGDHTIKKFELVSEYAKGWAHKILGYSQSEGLIYIDGMCNCGKYYDSFNGRMLSNYKQQARELLFKVLNRRSDRKSYTREGFIEMLKYYPLAMPKIYVSLF